MASPQSSQSDRAAAFWLRHFHHTDCHVDQVTGLSRSDHMHSVDIRSDKISLQLSRNSSHLSEITAVRIRVIPQLPKIFRKSQLETDEAISGHSERKDRRFQAFDVSATSLPEHVQEMHLESSSRGHVSGQFDPYAKTGLTTSYKLDDFTTQVDTSDPNFAARNKLATEHAGNIELMSRRRRAERSDLSTDQIFSDVATDRELGCASSHGAGRRPPKSVPWFSKPPQDISRSVTQSVPPDASVSHAELSESAPPGIRTSARRGSPIVLGKDGLPAPKATRPSGRTRERADSRAKRQSIHEKAGNLHASFGVSHYQVTRHAAKLQTTRDRSDSGASASENPLRYLQQANVDSTHYREVTSPHITDLDSLRLDPELIQQLESSSESQSSKSAQEVIDSLPTRGRSDSASRKQALEQSVRNRMIEKAAVRRRQIRQASPTIGQKPSLDESLITGGSGEGGVDMSIMSPPTTTKPSPLGKTVQTTSCMLTGESGFSLEHKGGLKGPPRIVQKPLRDRLIDKYTQSLERLQPGPAPATWSVRPRKSKPHHTGIEQRPPPTTFHFQHSRAQSGGQAPSVASSRCSSPSPSPNIFQRHTPSPQASSPGPVAPGYTHRYTGYATHPGMVPQMAAISMGQLHSQPQTQPQPQPPHPPPSSHGAPSDDTSSSRQTESGTKQNKFLKRRMGRPKSYRPNFLG